MKDVFAIVNPQIYNLFWIKCSAIDTMIGYVNILNLETML